MAQIKDAFPELDRRAGGHPGVGFIMVLDDVEGGLVIGKEGVYYLETDTFEGVNPLEPYGPLAPQLLRRTNGFDTCPDILCISTYWPETGEVAAFEELDRQSWRSRRHAAASIRAAPEGTLAR